MFAIALFFMMREIPLPLQRRLWVTLQDNGIWRLAMLGIILDRNQEAYIEMLKDNNAPKKPQQQ